MRISVFIFSIASAFAGGPLLSAPTELDFNRDIQPILSENCYHCHGPDKAERKADLRLDEEKGAKIVTDGVTAIKPGQSAESELIKRIFSDDPDEVMPTPKSNRKLSAEQKEKLKRWIDEGAKWGVHWALVKPVKPPVPKISDLNTAIKNPIDAFVLAKLKQEGLKPSPEATRETLIRRVTLDLTGLPPTPEDVDAFLRDDSPQAYERVVDRLLNSPRYGERWCWDWLDAARYADTNGFQGDPTRTMWPWRDWVIKAINQNMRYDKFTEWQLAGDLLPNATTDQKLASGFNRNHMMNGEGGRIAEESRVENVMDRVETTGTVWLGLTIGCCRCHDHKFDPILQRDYFAFYDFFNQTSETGNDRSGQDAPVLDLTTQEESARLKVAINHLNEVAKEVEDFELVKFPRPKGKRLSDSEAGKLPGNLSSTLAGVPPAKRNSEALPEAINYFKDKDADYVKLLEKLLASVRDRQTATTKAPKVMIMDTLAKPRSTFVLAKGAYDKPTTEKVTAGTPSALPSLPANAPKNRLGLAQWLVSPENPLTARVTVNRFWQAFFSIGLVKTAEDFGVQGEKPVHQELLDWLAIYFMENGWDVKALHKLIVMSGTYRQSSKITTSLHERDPENRLLSHGARFRMPSWMIRDGALAQAGLLKEKLGGAPVKPYQPEGIWEEATFGKTKYQQDKGDALYRRTLYTFWRRIVGPTMLFDNAARQVCSVKMYRTNTPLHALTTLNDVTYVEAARAMAQRIIHAEKEDDARLNLAIRLATARMIKPDEKDILLQRLKLLKTQFSEDRGAIGKLLSVGESPRDMKLDGIEHAAWTALCQLILNLDEAITKE